MEIVRRSLPSPNCSRPLNDVVILDKIWRNVILVESERFTFEMAREFD